MVASGPSGLGTCADSGPSTLGAAPTRRPRAQLRQGTSRPARRGLAQSSDLAAAGAESTAPAGHRHPGPPVSAEAAPQRWVERQADSTHGQLPGSGVSGAASMPRGHSRRAGTRRLTGSVRSAAQRQAGRDARPRVSAGVGSVPVDRHRSPAGTGHGGSAGREVRACPRRVGPLGRRAVGVRLRLAVLAEPDDEQDGTDQWHEGDQQPPA
jgi:hypothetical protein